MRPYDDVNLIIFPNEVKVDCYLVSDLPLGVDLVDRKSIEEAIHLAIDSGNVQIEKLLAHMHGWILASDR